MTERDRKLVENHDDTRDLKHAEYRVLIGIARARKNRGIHQVTVEQLIAFTLYSRSAVGRALRNLKEKGLIRQSFRPIGYELLIGKRKESTTMQQSQRTWRWAIMIKGGVYSGDLTGDLEPGDTEESAAQQVAAFASNYIKEHMGHEIVACFVSTDQLFVSSPLEQWSIDLDITESYDRQKGGK